MGSHKKVLLLGSTGFLGSCLKQQLPAASLTVDVLDREAVDLGRPLGDAVGRVMDEKRYDCVIVCAAISDVERCFREPDLSHAVNVSGTIELFRLMGEYGAVPVFFSSDYVFSGGVAPYAEVDECLPTTVYGRQKLAVERFLETHFARFLIFRTSKLMAKYAHPRNILYPVVRDLRMSKPIQCLTDQWLNPVFVEDIAAVLKLAFVAGLTGVFHLGTRRIFTRIELAQVLAQAFACDANLIRPIRMADVAVSETRPTHNLLDCRKIEGALDFRFCEIEDALPLGAMV